jgi:hypothetical protein
MKHPFNKITDHTERYRLFINDAHRADRCVDAGADVYAAADVYEWLKQLARNASSAQRPKPLRK